MRAKLIFITVLLSSCSYLHVPVLSPYKMEIRQGNLVTAEMRDKLKLGMTKAQVRYVLGTPMISDAFHGNRWDYAYRLAQQGELVENQHLAVYFDGDNLIRVEEGGKPLQMEPLIPLAPAAPEPVAPEPTEAAVAAENAVAQAAAKADPAAEVLSSVQAWVTAWSSKNMHEYLAAYTPDFAPQYMSHDAWEKQRTSLISNAKAIEITLNNTSVSVQDDNHATVSFTQNYRSNAYRDKVEKTLLLVKQGDRWLIAEERVGKKTRK